MTPGGHTSIGWFRGLLFVFAIAGLTMLGLSFSDGPAPQRSKLATQDSHPVVGLGERPQLAPHFTRNLDAPMGGAIGSGAAPRAPAGLDDARYRSSWQPPPLPFKFLGKMTEGDETVVLLYGDGRTVFVRGAGPIDEDYVVEVVQESYLVLRQVSLGQSQVIPFAPAVSTIETDWSPESTPQD